MSITPLSAARIAGELSLAGGTATGGAFAAKYGSQIGESGKQAAIFKQDLNDQVKYSIQCLNHLNEMINDAFAMKTYVRDCKEHIKKSMESKVSQINWNGAGSSV